jgi:hypothetical protein
MKTMVRATDPETSTEGAASVQGRTPTQKMLLLNAYYANPEGLTDEEAGIITGLINKPKCSYWKRCSELEAEGYLMRTLFTRQGMTGCHMLVRTITEAGRKEVEAK